MFTRGDVTQIFYTNQAELLLEKASDTASQLQGYCQQPNEEQERIKLLNVAESLEAELGNIQKGERLASEELNRLGLQAKTIEDDLKEK